MPFLIRHFILLSLMLQCLGSVAQADRVKMSDGRIVENFLTVSITRTAEGGIFNVMLMEKGLEPRDRSQGLPLNQVSFIEFREMDDVSEETNGRLAHMIANDGDTAHNVMVLTGEWDPQTMDFVFTVRRGEEPKGVKTLRPRFTNLKTINFAPVLYPDSPIDLSEIERFRRRDELARAVESFAEDGKDSYLDGETDSGGQFQSTDNAIDQMTGISAVYGDRSPFKDESDKKDGGMFAISSDATGDQIVKMGLTFFLLFAVGLMALTFFAGSFVLMFAAKNSGIKDLTLSRAVMASALLAFIPPGLLTGFLVLSFILAMPFIQVIIWIAALFSFWISAKIIVAGMLEINESKAFDVLLQFYSIIIMFGCGYWIYAIL